MNHSPIQIATWEALSPIGVGSAIFPVANRTPVAAPLSASALPAEAAHRDYPTGVQYRPASFDVASILGKKGIRTMDRTTALTLCTSQLLHARLAQLDGVPLDRTGFVVGTSTGSIRSTSEFTRESLVQPRPFLVNPALFPNTVMNCAAGQCGIRFKAQSVNATISGGRMSGLIAFKYALQMLRRGYVDLLFTGSVEELCPQTAWAHQQLVEHGFRRAVALGEGCGMFTLARPREARMIADRAPVADILALQYGRYFTNFRSGRDEALIGILECIDDALNEAAIGADAISSCVLCGASDIGLAELEQQAAIRAFGRHTRIEDAELLERFGDTYSATFALALAWLLAQLGNEHRNAALHGLVLTTSEDGHVGCLIVRMLAG